MSATTQNFINRETDRRTFPHWYAVYTRSRYEKKVAQQFEERGVDYFLPLIPKLRQWKDRKKWVEMPLFPGYIFVNIKLVDSLLVLTAEGVVRLVGFNGKPSAIPEFEIENVRKLLNYPNGIEPSPFLNEGDWVEIIYGPFTGVRGRLIERHGRRRLLVGINLIRQAVSVEVDMSWVRRLSGSIKPHAAKPQITNFNDQITNKYQIQNTKSRVSLLRNNLTQKLPESD